MYFAASAITTAAGMTNMVIWTATLFIKLRPFSRFAQSCNDLPSEGHRLFVAVTGLHKKWKGALI